MELEVILTRWAILDEVDHSGHSILEQRPRVNRIPIILVFDCVQNDHVLVQDHLHYFLRPRVPTEPETLQLGATLVTLESNYVLG